MEGVQGPPPPEVLEWPYTIGGGGCPLLDPPPPLTQPKHGRAHGGSE